MKSWLEKNDIEMHSTHNEGKSVVAERFIKTIKNKIYKYMTSISKNVYIDKLDDIIHKYNNKSIEKLTLSLLVLKTIHTLTLVKNLMIMTLNLRLVIMQEYQNIKKQEFRIEKVIKRKSDKLYVKWKGYDNSFNSWTDKKDLV